MQIVACPRCNIQSTYEHYNFQYQRLDDKAKCTECKKYSSVNDWKCNCGIPWYLCKVHTCAKHTNQSRRNSRNPFSSDNLKNSASRTSVKRPTSDLDEVLDEDLGRESKRAKKVYEESSSTASTKPYTLRATMVCKNLRERFAHLFRE